MSDFESAVKAICAKLNEMREVRGLRQVDVAERAGITRPSLIRVEAGRCSVAVSGLREGGRLWALSSMCCRLSGLRRRPQGLAGRLKRDVDDVFSFDPAACDQTAPARLVELAIVALQALDDLAHLVERLPGLDEVI
ncbi:helix-turn-helix domain-containing protein [Roseateles sp. NT4]|uniref:helix-turn-helix domain-containing protein n=1 Tax=Roseateles sp. NT4 TaxID=3453715 RepID=UPI003EEE8837